MSRAVRPRPVDVYKPLQIHYGFVDDKELRYEDENGFMRTVVQGDSGGHHETIHVPRAEEIVVQDCEIVPEYDTEPHEKFKRGNAYIKQRKPPEDAVEYVAEDDDMEWLDNYNAEKPSSEALSIDLMELMIDRFERAAMGGTLEQATAEKLHFGREKAPVVAIQSVYEWWNSKRMKLANNYQKALLLRYRTLKNNDDPDPNVVFRPREREYQTRKKTRKNDKKSFQKMVDLRLNFERTRNILELMKQREKLKQERIQLMQSAFEVQLQMLQKQAKEDPTAEREVHSQFLQDEPPATARVTPTERPARLRMPSSSQFNPYERDFHSQDHQRMKRSRPDPEPEPEVASSPARQIVEPQTQPKSGGKLKPPKKRVMLAGNRQRSSASSAPGGPPAEPPVPRQPRIIYSLTNKDATPVDFHQVHESGKIVTPMADDERSWSTFRYTSRGRVGRGGRIIFDRVLVKNKMEDPRYGIDVLDWNITSAATMKLWKNDSICSQILREAEVDHDDLEEATETPIPVTVTSAS